MSLTFDENGGTSCNKPNLDIDFWASQEFRPETHFSSRRLGFLHNRFSVATNMNYINNTNYLSVHASIYLPLSLYIYTPPPKIKHHIHMFIHRPDRPGEGVWAEARSGSAILGLTSILAGSTYHDGRRRKQSSVCTACTACKEEASSR